MSAEQARSLLGRLYTVLSNRLSLTNGSWKDNSQKQAYIERNVNLSKSKANIEKLKKSNGEYNIEQHEDAFASDTAVPEDPNDYAKFVIKAMDGIAILNTILNINDIRGANYNMSDIDTNRGFNGLVNEAIRSLHMADSTKHNWSYNNTYKKEETKDGKKRVYLYPHLTTDTGDTVWYNYTKKFYKYYNTITMRNGSVNLPVNPYYAYKPGDCADNYDAKYSFVFDDNFISIMPSAIIIPGDQTGRTSQKQYILKVIDDISPHATTPSTDFVKYVKDFAVNMDRIGILTTPTDSQMNPISSAFDYYLLDYLTQILESEYELFVTLKTIYSRKQPDTSGVNDVQRMQFNDAPFYGATCNGASCVGLCYGSCVNTCNGCGGCASFCTTTCGGACKNACSTCSAGCDDMCKDQCGGLCDASCVANCRADCTEGCSSGCTGCSKTCSTACISDCRGDCISNCKDGCKENCKGSCGNECGAGCGYACKSDSTAPAIVANQGTTTRGGPNVQTIVVVGENGVGYIAATNVSGQMTYVGNQSQNYSPNARDYNNPGRTDSSYQNKYPSGGPPPVPAAPKLAKSIP